MSKTQITQDDDLKDEFFVAYRIYVRQAKPHGAGFEIRTKLDSDKPPLTLDQIEEDLKETIDEIIGHFESKLETSEKSS